MLAAPSVLFQNTSALPGLAAGNHFQYAELGSSTRQDDFLRLHGLPTHPRGHLEREPALNHFRQIRVTSMVPARFRLAAPSGSGASNCRPAKIVGITVITDRISSALEARQPVVCVGPHGGDKPSPRPLRRHATGRCHCARTGATPRRRPSRFLLAWPSPCDLLDRCPGRHAGPPPNGATRSGESAIAGSSTCKYAFPVFGATSKANSACR